MGLRSVQLELLTWPEVAALGREATVAIIPTAAVEQHGPHLPFDTDAFLCSKVALAAAERASADGPVLVGPTLSLGASGHHLAFPGTLTLTSSTFTAYFKDVATSLARHGFRRQLVVNGHGGNTFLLAQALHDLHLELPLVALTLDYWNLAIDVAEEVRESPLGGMGHACEFETSLMLHLRPDVVRTSEISRQLARPRYAAERLDMFASSPVFAPWRTEELSESGVIGAPDLASAEKGRRLFETCVERLAELIGELRSAPLPSDRRR